MSNREYILLVHSVCSLICTHMHGFFFIAPSSANNWEDVQAKARHLLLHTYGLSRCTVQVQTHRQRLVRSCANCQQPSA